MKLFFPIVLFLATIFANADTPPPPGILNLRGGAANGAITAFGGTVSSVAPGTSGNVLTSNGTTWVSSPATGGGGGTWGSITGTLSDQTDLASALSGKVSTTAVIDIAHGGSGQITAPAALNAFLPTQTGNAGKVLSTDGTDPSWIAVSGTGTVTNVQSTDGSVDITSGTTVPNLSVHFPMSAPGGTVGAPSFRFDADTGAFSTGDGNYSIATNGVSAISISNNQNITAVGSVTAADFIYPVKTAHYALMGPTTGSPAVPTFRAIGAGDVPEAAIPFPLHAPSGNQTTGYCFDSDTCAHSTGDGSYAIATNNVDALSINNNQQAIFAATVTATDFVYPTKTANTFLAGPVSGSPAVPGFRTIQNGDISEDDLPWPLHAPGGGVTTGYCFDSDTCVHGVSDGTLAISTNNVDRMTFYNNGLVEMGGTLQVGGDVTVTGNISAANYPPVGSANTLARFNNAGSLDASVWSIDPDSGALSSIQSLSGTIADFTQIRNQHNLDTVTGTVRSIYMALSGSNAATALTGWQLDANVPVTGDLNLTVLQSSSAVGGNAVGMGLYMDSAITGSLIQHNVSATNTVGTDYYGYYVNAGPDVGGNANLFGSSFYGTTVTGDLSLFNAGVSNGTSILNNYRGIQGHNSASVAQFAQLVTVSQSGVVTKGLDVFTSNISANVGDGTGVQLNGFNMSTGTITVDGNLNFLVYSGQANVDGQFTVANVVTNGTHEGWNGLQFNNSGNMVGNNNFYVINAQNTGTGYRFEGIQLSNNANMTEEIRGFYFNTVGDARTATGIDAQMTGTYTDDARFIRYNLSGASVTNGRLAAIEGSGGVISIQSSFNPASSAFVDIGNNISVTGTVLSGSPITGSDMFMSFFQSNLIAGDDISLGPLGLGTTMNGFLSQVDVASGKTIPFLRSALIGTSVPSGSGGTITKHAAVQVIGLPSFGGTVTNGERIGFLEETLLGQNFCDGATDCWLLRLEDTNSENYLNKLAIGTSSKKTSTAVKLEVHDGHTRYTQTTAPTATPDANAGTGATCNVAGTDLAGSITLVTGTLGWAAGAQCAVTFNTAFGATPKCVFSPNNDNASLAGINTNTNKTTTDLTIRFVTADIASTQYEWDYKCDETN